MKDIAVMISDVHFSVKTLAEASEALLCALQKAQELSVPFIVAGDLINDKAVIRAEVANALVSILSEYPKVTKYILVGNHDMLNEKGDTHSLNFLRPYAYIIDKAEQLTLSGKIIHFLPYQSDIMKVRQFIQSTDKKDLLVMHQGIVEADMGHYVVDKSAISVEEFRGRRVISGHYHNGQTVDNFSYLGSPYTMTFSEANDFTKGFSILRMDGSLKRVSLNLRAHVLIETDENLDLPDVSEELRQEDIIKVVVRGPNHEIVKITKNQVSKSLGITNFTLDFKADAIEDKKITKKQKKQLTQEQLFDAVLEGVSEDKEHVDLLKSTWRELVQS